MTSSLRLIYLLAISIGTVALVGCELNVDSTAQNPSAKVWPSDLVVPIRGTTFSLSEKHLPGAPRDYRAGGHQGFDFSNGQSARPLANDEPIVAIADGEIIRIDHDYEPPEPAPLAYYSQLTDEVGFIADYALDRLRGRQIWIRHEDGHISRYAHLSGVHPELQPGDLVEQGQAIGLMGNTGIPATEDQLDPNPRLHLELWTADGARYLGQDRTPLETHQLLASIFGREALPRYARQVLQQVESGEQAPDPYPPEKLPDTSFSLEPPVLLTPGAPFAAAATWDGDDFQPEDFFTQLAGRPVGVIDAGNGAWLLGALPMDYSEPEAQLMVGAADAYGKSLVGGRMIEVNSRTDEEAPIEVSEAVMTAYHQGDTQSENQTLMEAGLRALQTTTPRWTTPFHAPLEGKVTRHFGQQIVHGLLRPAHPLPGVTIEADSGAQVNASNTGRVVLAVELPVRGKTVAVDHGGGVVSVYAHLAEISVTHGENVERGQALGRAGDSGIASQSQVRWEIHVAGTPTNPLDWHQQVLPKQQTAPAE